MRVSLLMCGYVLQTCLTLSAVAAATTRKIMGCENTNFECWFMICSLLGACVDGGSALFKVNTRQLAAVNFCLFLTHFVSYAAI